MESQICISNQEHAEAELLYFLKSLGADTSVTFIREGEDADDGHMPPRDKFWLFQVGATEQLRVYEHGKIIAHA